MDVKIYFFLFLIYSVLGWCMEVISGAIEEKKFVNRGFLVGPCCPIYGCGAVLITVLLKDIVKYPPAVFCTAIVICGVLEYLTSYIMEKIFKARWWDYSKKKFNINGRVCLETIIPFGLLSCMILYLTNPFFINVLEKIPEESLKVWFIVSLIIFCLDCIISFVVIFGLRKTVKQVNKNQTTDNTEEITKKVREILLGQSVLERRLIKAFPKISIEAVKQKIKETTEQVRENVAKVKESTIKFKDEASAHIKVGTSKLKSNRKNKKK